MAHKKITLVTEEQRLAESLNRSYTERFRMLMRLIRLSQKVKAANQNKV